MRKSQIPVAAAALIPYLLYILLYSELLKKCYRDWNVTKLRAGVGKNASIEVIQTKKATYLWSLYLSKSGPGLILSRSESDR